MKIKVIVVGKTEDGYLKTGIDEYLKRLKHYCNLDLVIIPAIKTKLQDFSQQKKTEGELILQNVQTGDFLVLLDETGEQFSSVNFSKFLQQQMNKGLKTLVFVIGGPFGFSDEVYNRSNFKLSLSKMTFSHQMVRLFFFEQLYRGFTILKGEKYHHE